MLLELIKKKKGIVTSSCTHRIPCLYLTTVGNCSFSGYNIVCNAKQISAKIRGIWFEQQSGISLDLIEDTFRGYLKCKEIQISWAFFIFLVKFTSMFNILKQDFAISGVVLWLSNLVARLFES